jgi:hypothetical protein
MLPQRSKKPFKRLLSANLRTQLQRLNDHLLISVDFSPNCGFLNVHCQVLAHQFDHLFVCLGEA